MISLSKWFQRSLFIGAHVDDVELFAGGTISRCVREGCGVGVVCFSRHKGVMESPPNEFALSMDVFGVGPMMSWCDDLMAVQSGPNSFNARRGEISDCLRKWRDSFQPTIVVTHQSSDTNQDHQQVFNEVLRIFKGYCSIICGCFPSNDIPAAERNLLVELTEEDIKRKTEAVMRYDSQRAEHRNYLHSSVLFGQACYWGSLCEKRYAEQFEVVRLIV